jgi:GNAT superfamily N-acetyltransferase
MGDPAPLAPPRPPEGLSIRLLAPADSMAEVTALLHRGYARLAAMGFNYTAVDQTEDVTRRRCAEGETFVATLRGRLVGTLTLLDEANTGGSPWLDRDGVASLGQFAVEPALQRLGIGRALMDAAEARAREKGVEHLAGDTSEGATHLIAYYAALGFRVVERVRWPGKTYASVVLSKPLRPAVTAPARRTPPRGGPG